MLGGYLSGLPAFLAYFATAVVMVALFAVLYVQITAHQEFRLIRQCNLAAVAAFLGAVAGFVLPVIAAMHSSVNLVDFVIWAAIAAVVQIAVYFGARLMMPDVSQRIVAGEVAGGLFLGGMAVIFGMINAASMTP
jgi:putative membrane protein